MLDPRPGHLRNVQQAVNAAQVNKGAVIGDAADDALADFAFFERGQRRLFALPPLVFGRLAVGKNDLAAVPVHFDDFERDALADILVQVLVLEIAGADMGGGNEAPDAQVHDQAALDALGDHRVQDRRRCSWLR